MAAEARSAAQSRPCGLGIVAATVFPGRSVPGLRAALLAFGVGVGVASPGPQPPEGVGSARGASSGKVGGLRAGAGGRCGQEPGRGWGAGTGCVQV